MQNQNQHVFMRRRKGANQRISITMEPDDAILLKKIETFLIKTDPEDPMSQSKAVCIALKYARNWIVQNNMEIDLVEKVFE